MTINIETLLDGEKALENAPKTALADGRLCIPQHYLSYHHTLKSVEQIILDIDCDPRYPIFVSQDNTAASQDPNAGIYIQVGIIGIDNYKSASNAQEKIVYGRKWRVEPQLPTSEIIQTVFLAVKKAREHEIRELFRLAYQGKSTTPFNNHHDLPLLTNSRDRVRTPVLTDDAFTDEALFITKIKQVLRNVSYGNNQFELMNLMPRPTGEYLVDLQVTKVPTDQFNTDRVGSEQLSDLADVNYMSFFINKLTVNYFLHQLMQELINISDRYIDETFFYRGFNRFSWDNDVAAISQLSTEVRQLHKSEDAKNFTLHWQQTNYETDQSRIPVVSSGPLWSKLQNQLDSFSLMESTMPIRAF